MQKQKSPTKEQQKTYQDIIKLYDYAESMIDAIEQNPYPNPELRLKLIEPVIEQIEESVEMLADIHIKFIETGRAPDDYEKMEAENAIRKIFAAIDAYKEAVKRAKFVN